jgi:hypothetical protein
MYVTELPIITITTATTITTINEEKAMHWA